MIISQVFGFIKKTDNENRFLVSIDGYPNICYDVWMPAKTQPVESYPQWIYLHEKYDENGHSSYGFMSQEDRAAFKTIIGVPNIGPYRALCILDIGIGELVTAIKNKDVAFLMQIDRVGKAMANQMIISLEKWDPGAKIDVVRQDAVKALGQLGLVTTDAKKAVAGVAEYDGTLNNLITLSLKYYDEHIKGTSAEVSKRPSKRSAKRK